MPRYAVTFGFVQHVTGATETYISQDMTGTIRQTTLQNLINKRNDMLYPNTKWTGIRITQVPLVPGPNNNRQRSTFLVPGYHDIFGDGNGITIPAQGIYAGIPGSLAPDQARACIIQRFRYDTDRWARRYLAFVPDAVLHQEPGGLTLSRDNTWTARYISFIVELTSGRWFIRARTRGDGFTEIPILKWTQSQTAPTNVGVVLASAPPPNFAQNDKIQIKNTRRRGTDKTSYNGIYIVDTVNLTFQTGQVAVYLKASETGNPDSVKKNGLAQKVGHTYYTIQQVLAHQAGVHKRGKPLGSPRGRVLKRVLLDP